MDNPLLNLPPLDAIRGFVAVARRMSITLAAQDLCLTQSAVSRQIQSLEEHLGTPLLVRKHRAIELTDAGHELLKLAAPCLDQLAAFSESQRRRDQLRPVTITASISVTSLWILPRLGAFQDQHPHIDVRVSSNNRMLNLEQEGIDFAIRYARASDVPPDAIRLFDEKVLPMASPKVAARAFRSAKALLSEVLLEYDERALPWLRWSDWLTAAGMPNAKPKAYLHANHYDQVVRAAVAGHGVALGRVALVLPLLQDGRLVAIADQGFGNSDYAYWLLGDANPARAELHTFRDWIMQEAKRGAQELQSKLP